MYAEASSSHLHDVDAGPSLRAWDAIPAAMRHGPRRVNPASAYVFAYLASLARRYDDVRPGIATIAQNTGLGQRTVHRCIDELEAAQWITVVRTNGGRGISHKYHLNWRLPR